MTSHSVLRAFKRALFYGLPRARLLVASVVVLFAAAPAANAAVASGRSVVALSPGQVMTFKNAGSQLYVRTQQNSAWGPWVNLGGWIKGTPQAISWGANHADVYVRWGDDSVYHRWWNGSSWSGWERIGTFQVSSDIAPISWGYGRIDLFARGLDGALVHNWFDSGAGGWPSDWEWMNGYILGTPSVVSWYAGHLDVYFREGDSRLMHRWIAPGYGWSAWLGIGSWQLGSDPVAGTAGNGHSNVVARGLDNALINVWFNGSNWSDWGSLGGAIVGKPTIVSWGANHLDVYARGTDNALWHRWNNGSTWAPWESLGGGTVGDPVAATWGSGHIDVHVPGTDGQAWHRAFVNGWQGWEALGVPNGAYYPTSAMYGGANGSVNTTAELDRLLEVLGSQASGTAGTNLVNGLTAADLTRFQAYLGSGTTNSLSLEELRALDPLTATEYGVVVHWTSVGWKFGNKASRVIVAYALTGASGALGAVVCGAVSKNIVLAAVCGAIAGKAMSDMTNAVVDAIRKQNKCLELGVTYRGKPYSKVRSC